jgi:hypothetical protein
MGSYCALLFDNWQVIHTKSVVPDELCALFQESDRIVTPSYSDESDDIKYLAPREVLLGRLDILGCTAVIYWDAQLSRRGSASKPGLLESARISKINLSVTWRGSKRSRTADGDGVSHAF